MDAVSQLNASLTGRYAIRREIGRGGMATVYLAHDVRHERNVALKVLNPELGAVLGGERFLSEIRVTANLQHPNLLPLFDSGDAEGHLYYVMPFVEGESLRARLTREKQLPVDEAVRIAKAVASALDYAHSHGVIHRDLKPENILMQAGQPVLADFGIALAVVNAGGTRITQTGLSLGTPQYMSPEQATGDRVIDGRTDTYSLGAVLYEMLSGDPPYGGSTAQAIIARLLTEKPRSVRAVRDTVPGHVELAVERALAKLPADRFATAREFSEALDGTRRATGFVSGPAAIERQATIALPLAGLRSVGKWAAVAALVAFGTWGWLRPAPAPADKRLRFALALPDSVRLREDLGGANLALSPDGLQFAYVGGGGTGRIYLRGLNELISRPVPGTEGALTPRFSPDGQWLAFTTRQQLRKVPLAGGPMVVIAEGVSRYAWGENDVIVFGRTGGGQGGLYRVSAAGGPVVALTNPDTARGELGHTWPEFLPGGDAVVFTTQGPTASSSELAAVRLDDGEIVRLGIRGVNPRYVHTGHLLFGQIEERSVVAAAFDPRALRVVGPTVTLLEDVVVKGGGATEIAVAPDGTMAYVEGAVSASIVIADTSGRTRHLLGGDGSVGWPRVSPDGERIAFHGGTGATRDIWVHHLRSGTTSRLTRDGQSTRPAWTRDGQRIAWVNDDSGRRVVRWQAWDGRGRAEVLNNSNLALLVADFSRNGDFFVSTSTVNGSDIWLTTLGANPESRALVDNDATNFGPKISPDGQWLAFASTETGNNEVYVMPIGPDGGGRHQVSNEGGVTPVWSPDGRTIYYRGTGNQVIAATLATTPAVVVTQRTVLPLQLGGAAVGAEFDVFPRGSDFVVRQTGGTDDQRAIIVVGWLDELRERVRMAAGR